MAKKLLCLAVVSLSLVAVAQGLVWADPAEHQIKQVPPIKLGTSGGNINDSSSIFCCGGTLGALVEDGDLQKYILSNNHVLARTNSASSGEYIIHPGLIDQDPVCTQNEVDTVAHLSDFVQIRFKKGKSVPLNEIDAAIAQVVEGAVDPNGAILEIDEIISETVDAAIGQDVKKSGRTTGLTFGKVEAINVTVDVSYSKECGGGAKQVARFENQILIIGTGFSAGGDSGSLIVEDVVSNPKAVGLLFAGSSDGSTTLANPINAVLAAFGVAMPGGVPPGPKPSGTISGTVTSSADGNVIWEATVEVVDTDLSATTDTYGVYSISDVAGGEHSVKASANGFESQTKSVTVNEGETTVDFALKPRKGKGKPSRQAAINRAIRMKKRHEQNIFQIDGVVGTGISLSETGRPVIEIYLKEDLAEARARIPASLDNVPVRVVVTGPFEAF